MRRIYDRNGEVDPDDERLIDVEWDETGVELSEVPDLLEQGYMLKEPDWDKQTDNLLKLRAEIEALPDD